MCLFDVVVSYFQKPVASLGGKVQAEKSSWYFAELPERKVVEKEPI